jgi:purine-binding chemotaxis protein CheW
MHCEDDITELVTFMIGGQLFGLPIARVQDVFKVARMTRVPLAAAEIAGVLNLRGRIVTVLDMRSRLGASARARDGVAMAIGIERAGESFGLLVEAIGEVVKLRQYDREPVPINLDRKLAVLATGVFRVEAQLLVELDVDRVLALGGELAAA